MLYDKLNMYTLNTQSIYTYIFIHNSFKYYYLHFINFNCMLNKLRTLYYIIKGHKGKDRRLNAYYNLHQVYTHYVRKVFTKRDITIIVIIVYAYTLNIIECKLPLT